MASIVEFHKAVLSRFGREKKRQQAIDQAVANGRAIIYTLGMLLESQRISPVTTTIVRDIGGHKQRIALLEVIRGAEVAFNELEAVNE